MSTVWTDERRKAYSEMAKARWADPFYRANHGKTIQKPPQCPTCGEKDIANFYVDKLGRRTNKHCRECCKKQCNARWYSRSELDRQASRAYKYGITAEDFKRMYKEQNGKCKICCEEPATKRGLHVDHCHETGKVRGLLCHGCNVALGSFKDNINLLEKAIEYLKE